MILIIEGPDRCGKSTQILKTQPLLTDRPLHTLHYSSIKGFKTSNEVKTYSEKLYKSMFTLLRENHYESHFILDRSHIGEVVYSPMYRKYDGSYVYDIEKLFSADPDFWSELYLITFIDNAENVIKRDDGLSFTTELEKKKIEIQAFVDATNRSHILNKTIININNKDIAVVHEEVKSFLGK